MGNGEPQPAGFLGNLSVEQEKGLEGLRLALVDLYFPESGLEQQQVKITKL